MSDTLRLERRDGVAVLTFNRPQAMNALDLATMRRFAGLVDDLAGENDLRAVVLAGAGTRAFCSGGDLVELSRYPAAGDARDMIDLMGDALLALERLPVPVIAAVNGYALGGGSEIALACDMRIVDGKARLGLVHIRMGVTPGWGAGQRLLRLVGYPRAMEFLLRGHVMDPDELVALGLVNRVVEEGAALPAALDLARDIAQKPPRVVRAIKTLLQAGLNEPYEAALAAERDVFPPLWADEPHLSAVDEFLKKQLKNGE